MYILVHNCMAIYFQTFCLNYHTLHTNRYLYATLLYLKYQMSHSLKTINLKSVYFIGCIWWSVESFLSHVTVQHTPTVMALCC